MNILFTTLIALAILFQVEQTGNAAETLGSLHLESETDQSLNDLVKELDNPSPPSLSGGRGPIDAIYKQHVIMKSLSSTENPQEQKMILERIIKHQKRLLDTNPSIRSYLEAAKASCGDQAALKHFSEFLISDSPAIRIAACNAVGHFQLKNGADQLRNIALTDPYIILGQDVNSRIAFVAPVRCVALEALRQLGENVDKYPSVECQDGLKALEKLYLLHKDLRSQISDSIKILLSATFSKEKFRKCLLEYTSTPSGNADEREFRLMGQNLAKTVNKELAVDPPWPRDPESGEALPAPPKGP